MFIRKGFALAAVAALVVASCGGSTASPTPNPSSSTPASATPAASTPAASTATTVCDALTGGAATDLLNKICAAGKIVVGTDPNYPPQSFLRTDGMYEGFDIDTANEIGKRLGVTVEFFDPDFDLVVAGGWAGRFDISVGSVTVTSERQGVLDFSPPYYYTPAQMAATTTSGITTLEGLAGKVVCVGVGTTYAQWLNGELSLVGSPEPATPPTGATVVTLETDTDCAASAQSGRTDFDGWLTSSTTLDNAIKATPPAPFVLVGDPVFYEALAVAADKAGPNDTTLMAAITTIINDMHADGTLSASSMDWFDGLDLTTAE